MPTFAPVGGGQMNRKERTRMMTQTTFPEIQAAAQALESRIALTEGEIAQMKESIKAKKDLVRSWRKALNAFTPKGGAAKKGASAN